MAVQNNMEKKLLCSLCTKNQIVDLGIQIIDLGIRSLFLLIYFA